MLTERTGGISIVDRGEEVTTGGEIDRGDGVGKEEPLDSGICLGCQSSTHSEERECVAHPGVDTLDERVSGEEV